MADQCDKNNSAPAAGVNNKTSDGLTTAAPQTFDQVYPDKLLKTEEALLRKRRGLKMDEPVTDKVGLSFSGGGIRSATFCLGVLQSLAARGLLGRIDYLSTVSGGGYTGSFLTRLFSRSYVSGADQAGNVKESLSNVSKRLNSATQPLAPAHLDPIEWLRQNSRYLAPKGGDVALDLAVVLRNWISLQAVLLSFLLLLFALLQTARVIVDLGFLHLKHCFGYLPGLFDLRRQLGALTGLVYWSPWIDLLAPLLLFIVVPWGWSYWMIGYLHGPYRIKGAGREPGWLRHNAWRVELHPLYGLFAALILALGLVIAGSGAVQFAGALMLATGLATLVFFLYVLGGQMRVVDARHAPSAAANGSATSPATDPATPLSIGTYLKGALAWWRTVDSVKRNSSGEDEQSLELDALARNYVSTALASALKLWFLLAVLCLVDSLGQTLYVLWRAHSPSVQAGAGISAALAALLALGTRMSSSSGFLERYIGNLGPGVLLKILSSVAAVLLGAFVLIACDTLSQGVAWKFARPPIAVPATAAATATLQLQRTETTLLDLDQHSAALSAPVVTLSPAPAAATYVHEHSDCHDLLWCLLADAGLLVFCMLFGHAWAFLNRSSHHPLYRDRLTRAYLGASNSKRAEPGQGAITDPIPDDDAMCAECWTNRVIGSGAPLHLLNVTINETSSIRGKTVFRDRKGIGMAIGPAGLSAGATHHALFKRSDDVNDPLLGGPDDGSLTPVVDEGDYSMFGKHGAEAAPERLSLGQWMAISGAAFSTGMGYNTTLALSLLTGFANVRLGYWWNSGIDPAKRNRSHRRLKPLSKLMRFLFPVQNYLFNELTARFRGPDTPHWYLSDGGSFENMGGYELIRRRLPVMIVVDGEEDPDYSYEGLANLVRKARMDFGAEIAFLSAEQIAQLNMPQPIAECFGDPQQLRPDADGYSKAHAGLATVRYGGAEQPQSVLIWLKPTLKADVPADVREYQQKNKPFPQQPTVNQFFDEAQWESYRRLGEYIASKVFADAAQVWDNSNPSWHPRLLTLPRSGLPG